MNKFNYPKSLLKRKRVKSEVDESFFGETVFDETTGETVLVEEGRYMYNKNGIFVGDIFWTKYKDINIFLCVGGTRSNKVAVFEIESKFESCSDNKDEKYELILTARHPKRRPLLVKENNCYSKTEFWVDVDDKGNLLIPLDLRMPICQLDLARGRAPRVGVLIAKPLKNLMDYFPEGSQFKNKTIHQVPFPAGNKPDWIKKNEKKHNLKA